MKSLELINERIENLESRLESANYLANGNPSEFGKTFIGDLSKHLDSCKQIKADLEVLEILKSKLLLNHCPEEYPVREAYILVFVEKTNKELACEVTKEEYNKLKQWLEEQE